GRAVWRAAAAGDVRAARILCGGGRQWQPGSDGTPPLVEALRRRPLHKLNLLLRQVVHGTGPDPERLRPLAHGAAARWEREAARRRRVQD
ncbi:unnamed protein product, partial [Prorocentrum cordatum]